MDSEKPYIFHGSDFFREGRYVVGASFGRRSDGTLRLAVEVSFAWSWLPVILWYKAVPPLAKAKKRAAR